MKTVDHSYEQALIMHDNVHIHVIMNIIMTPTLCTAWMCCTRSVHLEPHESENPIQEVQHLWKTL